MFALWTGGTTPNKNTPRFSEIGIILSSDQDVDNLYNEYKKNPDINILHKPRTEVFGRTFLVEDPDGHM